MKVEDCKKKDVFNTDENQSEATAFVGFCTSGFRIHEFSAHGHGMIRSSAMLRNGLGYSFHFTTLTIVKM